MKKFLKGTLALSMSAVLIAVAGTSCSTSEPTPNGSSFVENAPQTETHISEINRANISPAALKHYRLISDVIMATTNKAGKTRAELNRDDEAIPAEPECIFYEKVHQLNIEDENGDSIKVVDMEEEEKQAFLDQWSVMEAAQLSEKIVDEPGLQSYVEEENRIIEELLSESGVPSDGADSVINVSGTRSGKSKYGTFDRTKFFKLIGKRMSEFNAHQEASYDTRSGYGEGNYTVPFSTVRSGITAFARKGDLILRLPVYNQPSYLISYSNWNVGHVSIVSTAGSSLQTAYSNTKFAIGANINRGVVEEIMDEWCRPSYVMGVSIIKYVWKWRGLRSGLYRTVTQVANPSAVANEAYRYLGKSYCSASEFLGAKWAAPHSFICTTLAWYCVKNALGVNITDWWTVIPTPSNIYLNENTYVRKRIY